MGDRVAVVAELQKRLLDLVVDGFGMYAGKKLVEFVKPYTVKTLKQYNDPVIKVAISLADMAFPKLREMPYVGDWLSLWGRDGVRDAAVLLIDKPPLCWADDANTMHCINFDTTTVTVKIDGASVTPSSISGTPEDFTISLATALSAGAHDLLVAGNKAAWSGKVYV